MAAVGPLVFCADCGNLLPPSKGTAKGILVCRCCGAQNQDLALQSVLTHSKPSDFPSPLRQKLSTVQMIDRSKLKTGAVIKATCPECGRTKVRYTTAQIRSADEGATVFYHCDCGHNWNLNQ